MITRATLPAALRSPISDQDPAIRRLLGRTHELGPALGLDDAWPINVLTALGSYSDLISRTLTITLPTPPALPLK